jgi:hypothetical protein
MIVGVSVHRFGAIRLAAPEPKHLKHDEATRGLKATQALLLDLTTREAPRCKSGGSAWLRVSAPSIDDEREGR